MFFFYFCNPTSVENLLETNLDKAISIVLYRLHKQSNFCINFNTVPSANQLYTGLFSQPGRTKYLDCTSAFLDKRNFNSCLGVYITKLST